MVHVLDRLLFMRTAFFIFTTLFILRFFQLQVLERASVTPGASGAEDVPRGEIVVADGPSDRFFPIAMNEQVYRAFADPSLIADPTGTVVALARTIPLSEDAIREKIGKPNDHYEPLVHGLSESQADTVKRLRIRGIGITPEFRRRYPAGELFAGITGFVGYDGGRKRGRYGIEEAYDAELAGQLTMVGRVPYPSGARVFLTLDYQIQSMVCRWLRETVQSSEAGGGTVLVMNPHRGDVLALCTLPTYDPNAYSSVKDQSVFVNDAVSRAYEPGSVFKSITLASAIDAGVIDPETTFIDTGSLKFGGFSIQNSLEKVYGIVTMTEVLDKSINTGAVFAALKLGPTLFLDYLKRFEFGRRVGIGFPGEGSGVISNVEKKKDIYTATASFGQGITVTTLQLARAYAVFANGGYLVHPRLVLGIEYPDERGMVETPVVPSTMILSRKTATTIAAMLGSVVSRGYGKAARVPGYFIAGKTGTAQVPLKDQQGYSDDTIHTFGGFFPVDDPRFVVVVKLDKPRSGRFADSTAAPLFGKVAAFLLQYAKIPPSVKE